MHFCVECNWWWVYVDHISTSPCSGLARCSLTQKKMRTRKKNKKGVEYEINVGLFWATHDDVFQLFMHCRHKTTVKNQLVVIGKKTDRDYYLKTPLIEENRSWELCVSMVVIVSEENCNLIIYRWFENGDVVFLQWLLCLWCHIC